MRDFWGCTALATAAALEAETPGRLDPALVEALAEHAHAVRLGEGPEGLAVGQGVGLLVSEMPAGFGGVAFDVLLAVKRKRDPAEVFVAELHELAHHVLDAARLDHTHADVWALALALGAPRGVVAALRRAGGLDAVRLAAATGLPVWAAWRRIEGLGP